MNKIGQRFMWAFGIFSVCIVLAFMMPLLLPIIGLFVVFVIITSDIEIHDNTKQNND